MSIENIFIISLCCSVAVLILVALRPLTDKRYSTRWRYFVWLVLAVRLVVPFRFEIENPPISIPVKNYNVVLTYGTGSFASVMDEEQLKNYRPKNPAASADGAPIATLEEVIFEIWILGATVFAAFHLISLFIFRIRIKPHMKKIKKNVFICEKIDTPMMVGFFKPIILIPDKKYTDDELDVIIRHEMTHFKRFDVWYKLLLVGANAMHWFNPVIYFMVRQATRDLEYSCDDLVVKNSDTEYKKRYSLTILKSMRKE